MSTRREPAHLALISGVAEEAFGHHRERFIRINSHWLEQSCESPIEMLLGAAVLAEYGGLCPFNYSIIARRPAGELLAELDQESSCFDVDCSLAGHRSDFIVALTPQCPVGEYRADFVLTAQLLCGDAEEKPVRKHFCVECDGHDFHERTKEQARRDRTRDRWFQAQGFTVLRFTGSEIVADARRCASEICGQVNTWLDEKRRLAGYPEEAFA